MEKMNDLIKEVHSKEDKLKTADVRYAYLCY